MRVNSLRSAVVALALLAAAAVPAAASLVDPSVEITGGVSGICDNSGGSLNPNVPTLLTYSALASDAASMSVQGVGIVATGEENLPFFPVINDVGSYGFGPAPYSVPAGTPVTVQITTYHGPDGTGGVSFVSTVVFDCDTGSVISLTSGPPQLTAAIPTLGALGLLLLAALLGAAAFLLLRTHRAAGA